MLVMLMFFKKVAWSGRWADRWVDRWAEETDWERDKEQLRESGLYAPGETGYEPVMTVFF